MRAVVAGARKCPVEILKSEGTKVEGRNRGRSLKVIIYFATGLLKLSVGPMSGTKIF